jgi:hypothetical protein
MGPFPLRDDGTTLRVSLVEVYEPATGLVTGHEIFEAHDRAGALLWRRDVPIVFRILTLDQLKDEAKDAGFTIEWVIGDYERAPYNSDTSPFIICTLRN